MSQPLRSPDPELQELRHRYNRLCARFAEASDIDPVSAAHTVQELQDLSDRIVAIEVRAEMATREGRQAGAPGPAEPGRSADRKADMPVAPPLPAAAAGDSPATVVALHKPKHARDGGAPDLPVSAGPPRRMTTAPADARPALRADGRAGAEDDAALGAAMRHWLRRHGLMDRGSGGAAGRPASATGTPKPATAPPAANGGVGRAGAEPLAFDFDRLYEIVKAQEAQIAAVLRRCEDHRRQLGAMERRLAERDPVGLLTPQIEALSAGLDQQRRRITSLAIAIQRLLLWLATERHRRRE